MYPRAAKNITFINRNRPFSKYYSTNKKYNLCSIYNARILRQMWKNV